MARLYQRYIKAIFSSAVLVVFFRKSSGFFEERPTNGGWTDGEKAAFFLKTVGQLIKMSYLCSCIGAMSISHSRQCNSTLNRKNTQVPPRKKGRLRGNHVQFVSCRATVNHQREPSGVMPLDRDDV